MHVAVLGGGLQGCCIAFALAEKGVSVTLFDRNEVLLSGAAAANEGKIHLGYMYANDRTLSTARMMMRGALVFAPFFAHHLGRSISSFASQRTSDEVCGYLQAVHELIGQAPGADAGAYFGIDLRAPLHAWSRSERDAELDSTYVRAAVATPELAIDPGELAGALRDCVATAGRIETRLSQTVLAVKEEDGRLHVVSEGTAGSGREPYDHVINALWDGRLAIDRTVGLEPARPWLHRLKYGVSFRRVAAKSERSVTVVSGPFGEVVSYRSGLTYLTWYPSCLQGISREVQPPAWETYAGEPLRSRVVNGTLKGLSEVLLELRNLDPGAMSDLSVKGGIIVASGKSDIYDPASELHRRFEIGITSIGRYHSVDPGKLTMAPYFAALCAERVAPADA